MNIHIKGGRLIDPASGTDKVTDLFIAAGVIAAIGAAPAGFSVDKTIDAAGLIVCPGLTDLAVRLREPGYEYRGTLETELAAAVKGGITTVVCPPDTDPPLDEPGLVEMLKHRARALASAHVLPLGALTVGLKGEVITEMAELAGAGCVGFTQADVPMADTQGLMRALQYAQTFGFPVWLRPVDAYLGAGGVAASGAVASRMGLSGVPVAAESVALLTLFELLRSVPTPVHVCRLSSARGVDLMRQAKAEGLPVTCDVAAHQLHLTDIDIGYFDPRYRLDPPLRGQRDRDTLRAAVADGTIDAIVSDHVPVDDDAKNLPFGEAEPGASGLELLLSLTLKYAEAAKLPLPQALAAVSSKAAKIATGRASSLLAGQGADICVFNPAQQWTVSRDSLISQSRQTPFAGHELPGVVRATLVAGRIVYEAR
ncbi:MAG: dihydroorotase [Burkholderiaceae bacterium]